MGILVSEVRYNLAILEGEPIKSREICGDINNNNDNNNNIIIIIIIIIIMAKINNPENHLCSF